MSKNEEMLEQLRATDVSKVVVGFSGYGDSGEVDEVYAKNAEDELVELTREQREWAEGLSDLAQWDWYNNEGGGGQVTVHVLTGKAVVEGYYNETIERPVDPAERALG